MTGQSGVVYAILPYITQYEWCFDPEVAGSRGRYLQFFVAADTPWCFASVSLVKGGISMVPAIELLIEMAIMAQF